MEYLRFFFFPISRPGFLPSISDESTALYILSVISPQLHGWQACFCTFVRDGMHVSGWEAISMLLVRKSEHLSGYGGVFWSDFWYEAHFGCFENGNKIAWKCRCQKCGKEFLNTSRNCMKIRVLACKNFGRKC